MKILLLGILAAFCLSLHAEEVRVLTFNIRYNNPADLLNAWPLRKEAVAKVITEHADIAGLQEVKPDQRAWLEEHLPQFGFCGIPRDVAGKDEAIPVIFRKDRYELIKDGTFWLSDTPEVPGSTTWGNKLPRVCTWAHLKDKTTGAGLWLFNAHLDHESAEAREKGLVLVGQRIAAREGNDPVVLTGDFNSSVGGAPLKGLLALEKPALVTSYEALGLPAEGTAHGFRGKTRGGAIDFILVEKERTKVKSGAILKTTVGESTDRFVSDHFPVEALIDFNR